MAADEQNRSGKPGVSGPLHPLVDAYKSAQSYSLDLVAGLASDEVSWRPSEASSSIAWHLGHQGAVNHYLVRNLTAAETSFNTRFDAVFDSATPEPKRGDLPSLDEIVSYRGQIAASTLATIDKIASGDVGAPAQLSAIATAMLHAIINHEYQHAKWIGEVRARFTDLPAPLPSDSRLVTVDGYYMVDQPS